MSQRPSGRAYTCHYTLAWTQPACWQ